jgi:hypothetical protein
MQGALRLNAEDFSSVERVNHNARQDKSSLDQLIVGQVLNFWLGDMAAFGVPCLTS